MHLTVPLCTWQYHYNLTVPLCTWQYHYNLTVTLCTWRYHYAPESTIMHLTVSLYTWQHHYAPDSTIMHLTAPLWATQFGTLDTFMISEKCARFVGVTLVCQHRDSRLDAITTSNYSYLMDCDAVSHGQLATVRYCEGSRLKDSDMLWNVGNRWPSDTTWQTRRLESWELLLR
jgi:hypothetical protein